MGRVTNLAQNLTDTTRAHALDEYTEDKFVHLDLSGRLDRRACPLLLSMPG